MLFEQAYVCYENPKMQGCLYLLEKIKSNLEKTGQEREQLSFILLSRYYNLILAV